MLEFLVGMGITAFGALVIYGNRVRILHSIYEVGASAEKRLEVGSKMLRWALSTQNPEFRHRELHLALDVVLCEGRIDELEDGSALHRKYWELGHRIAMEIRKRQEYLNIGEEWSAPDYDSARKLLHRRNGD